MNGSAGNRSVVIDGHTCGLPGVAFGGYVAGLLAAEFEGPAKVDFIRPAPLDIELSLEHDQATQVSLLDGDSVLAVGRPHETADDHPPRPAWEEAVEASAGYLAVRDNEYPNWSAVVPPCLTGEGMRAFPGPIKGHELVAASWSPSESFTAANGVLLPVYVWCALDCPGGLARRAFISSEPAVTAYLTVRQSAPILGGRPHLVTGWPVRQDGRKSFVGMAIFDRDGGLCAVGEALWVTASS